LRIRTDQRAITEHSSNETTPYQLQMKSYLFPKMEIQSHRNIQTKSIKIRWMENRANPLTLPLSG
jgi:hypothetical protein